MSALKALKRIIRYIDGSCYLLGFKVLGGWLPTASFKTSISYDDVMNPTEKIKVKYFKVAWLHVGWALVYQVKVSPMFIKNK
jgi:hypothetical protein|tara:strand:- start:61 stop:306 length:246 start_codon:yes stop_codon:yes gene_type:complete